MKFSAATLLILFPLSSAYLFERDNNGRLSNLIKGRRFLNTEGVDEAQLGRYIFPSSDESEELSEEEDVSTSGSEQSGNAKAAKDGSEDSYSEDGSGSEVAKAPKNAKDASRRRRYRNLKKDEIQEAAVGDRLNGAQQEDGEAKMAKDNGGAAKEARPNRGGGGDEGAKAARPEREEGGAKNAEGDRDGFLNREDGGVAKEKNAKQANEKGARRRRYRALQDELDAAAVGDYLNGEQQGGGAHAAKEDGNAAKDARPERDGGAARPEREEGGAKNRDEDAGGFRDRGDGAKQDDKEAKNIGGDGEGFFDRDDGAKTAKQPNNTRRALKGTKSKTDKEPKRTLKGDKTKSDKEPKGTRGLKGEKSKADKTPKGRVRGL